LPYFNKALADSIAASASWGAPVFPVDAYTAMSKNVGGTVQFDSTLFVDHVHPNAIGYNRLGNLIFSTMKNSNPPAIPKNQ
jgi:lysophospholipase L1-like esterase